jgi:hypothetical protein
VKPAFFIHRAGAENKTAATVCRDGWRLKKRRFISGGG